MSDIDSEEFDRIFGSLPSGGEATADPFCHSDEVEVNDPRQCFHCQQVKTDGEMIEGTDGCWECHETHLSQATGVGVVHYHPGLGAVLNGVLYRAR